METKLVPIDSIKVNPDNPRTIKPAALKKLVQSIEDFPEMLKLRPIVIDKNGVILGGNMRYQACVSAGLSEIPVVCAEGLTEAQKKEFIIKDNVSGGDWDLLKLSAWDPVDLSDWGLELKISDFSEVREDDYEIPDEVPTDIAPGDLFEIGDHRLLCGDSTNIDSYRGLFGENLADMVVTDPPYNVNYTGKTKEALTIQNDKMGGGDFYQFLYDFYTNLSAYTKHGGAWYVWHADMEGANFRQAFKNAGLKLAQCLIWAKNSMVLGRQDYHWQHEPCLYGWKEGAAHGWYSDRKQTTLLNFDRPTKNLEHPTMKPVNLIAYCIKNSSKTGDIIADCFGGSGTTMLAAEQTGRKAYLMELDPKYCQVIIDRMREFNPNVEIKRNGLLYE